MTPPAVVVRPALSALLDALPSDSVNCVLCGRTFANRSARRWHETRSHPDDATRHIGWRALSEQFGAVSGSSGVKFACPLDECEAKQRRRFASAKLLVQHYQKAHTEKLHRCADCPARFALRRDLKYHTKKVCPATRHPEETVADNETATTVVRIEKTTVMGNEAKSTVNTNSANKFFLTDTRYCPIQPRRKRKVLKSIGVQTEQEQGISSETVSSDRREMISVGTAADDCFLTSDVGCGPITSYYGNYDPATASTVLCDGSTDANAFDYYDTAADMYHMRQTCASTTTEPTYRQDSFAQTVYPQTVDFGTQYSMPVTFVGMPSYEYATTDDRLL